MRTKMELSAPAKLLMEKAQQKSCGMGHEAIATEHILLALNDSREGLVCGVFERLRIDRRRIAIETKKLFDENPIWINTGPLPLVPNAERVLEHAEKQARDMASNLIWTSDILIGLLLVPECTACKVLQDCCVDILAVRKAIRELVADGQVEQPFQFEIAKSEAVGNSLYEVLERSGFSQAEIARVAETAYRCKESAVAVAGLIRLASKESAAAADYRPDLAMKLAGVLAGAFVSQFGDNPQTLVEYLDGARVPRNVQNAMRELDSASTQ